MFREPLEQLASRFEGVVALVLVGADGLAVESLVLDRRVDPEMLSAELVALLVSMNENHTELAMGEVRGLNVSTGAFLVSAHEVSEGFYLLLVATHAAELGHARFELRRAPLVLAESLS